MSSARFQIDDAITVTKRPAADNEYPPFESSEDVDAIEDCDVPNSYDFWASSSRVAEDEGSVSIPCTKQKII